MIPANIVIKTTLCGSCRRCCKRSPLLVSPKQCQSHTCTPQHVSPRCNTFGKIRNLTKMNQTHPKCSKEGVLRYLKLLSCLRLLSLCEEKRIQEAAGSSLFRKFPPLHSLLNFFIAVISSLIDTISPPLSTIGGLLHHRGENNFIHWLHLILRSAVERKCAAGQQAVFLSAGCKSTHICGGEKNGGRSCVFWASGAAQGQEPANYCLNLEGRDGGVEDLSSNRGKSHMILKVGASGSGVAACICCCRARLSVG